MPPITADELVAAYQAEGYTKIEVKTGLTQIKVEAIMGTTKVEVIYDAATGAILKQEIRPAGPTAPSAPALSVAQVNRDFLGGGSNGDDDDDDRRRRERR